MQFLGGINVPGLRRVFFDVPVFMPVIEVIDVVQNGLMVWFQAVCPKEKEQFAHRSDGACTGRNLACSDLSSKSASG
jgi:hypothetical protein